MPFLSLPLDAAADACLLVAVHWLPGQHRIDRRAQIAARNRLVVAGAAVVELPKLERMSLRMMPLCASAFGPFDPSPG